MSLIDFLIFGKLLFHEFTEASWVYTNSRVWEICF